MTQAKFTPGPWFVSASGHTVYALHGEPQRNRFSALAQSGRSDDADEEELKANAHLMAAAPEMYAALVSADNALRILSDVAASVGVDKHLPGLPSVMEAVNSAIAKASA